jgi:hypothetical protein
VTQARDCLELAKRDWSDHSSSRCPPELATIRVRIHQRCTAVIPTLSPVPRAGRNRPTRTAVGTRYRGIARLTSRRPARWDALDRGPYQR